VTAFWALKDYILLQNDNLIDDLSGIICAFVNGSAVDVEQINVECSNAISFLITKRLVYPENIDISKGDNHVVIQGHVLDALMLLTGSESTQVRTRAFSTLSTLSTYAS